MLPQAAPWRPIALFALVFAVAVSVSLTLTHPTPANGGHQPTQASTAQQRWICGGADMEVSAWVECCKNPPAGANNCRPRSGHKIKGRVVRVCTKRRGCSAKRGIRGVTITARRSGTTLTATTGNTGRYAITGAPKGKYTVTPSLQGYRWEPKRQSVNVRGDRKHVDFDGCGPKAPTVGAAQAPGKYTTTVRPPNDAGCGDQGFSATVEKGFVKVAWNVAANCDSLTPDHFSPTLPATRVPPDTDVNIVKRENGGTVAVLVRIDSATPGVITIRGATFSRRHLGKQCVATFNGAGNSAAYLPLYLGGKPPPPPPSPSP